jgi:hypothetical protein
MRIRVLRRHERRHIHRPRHQWLPVVLPNPHRSSSGSTIAQAPYRRCSFEKIAGTIVDRIVDDASRPLVTLLNVFAGMGQQRDELVSAR